MGSSHHGFCVMRDGPGAGDLPPAQVSVLCRGHPGTSQGLSTPALASVLSERGARQASLINEETGLGRSVTARPRPVAGKGAPWTPPGYPPGHSPEHPPGHPRPMHVFCRTFPLVQLAPPEEEEMRTEEKGSGRAAEAGAEEQAATRGRRAGRLATLGLRFHHL